MFNLSYQILQAHLALNLIFT